MNSLNKNTLTYKRVGDYYIPDLILDDQPDKEIGIYCRMRQRYWSGITLAGTVIYSCPENCTPICWQSIKWHRATWTP